MVGISFTWRDSPSFVAGCFDFISLFFFLKFHCVPDCLFFGLTSCVRQEADGEREIVLKGEMPADKSPGSRAKTKKRGSTTTGKLLFFSFFFSSPFCFIFLSFFSVLSTGPVVHGGCYRLADLWSGDSQLACHSLTWHSSSRALRLFLSPLFWMWGGQGVSLAQKKIWRNNP